MMSLAVAAILAFGSPDDFFAPATAGGGEGISFTGSPSSRWDCSVCHDAAGTVDVRISTEGRDLVTQGYVPGEAYELTVAMTPMAPRASIALEIDRPGGVPSGRLLVAPPIMGMAAVPFGCTEGVAEGESFDPVVVKQRLRDDGSVIAEVAHASACGLSQWRVLWQAPAADEGSVTLYLSAVGSNDDSKNAGDVAHSLVLGIPSPSTAGQKTVGCSSTAGDATLLLLLILLISLSPRRGEGRGEGKALLLLALLVPTFALAAPKKKNPPPPALKTQPQPQPEPAPPPAPTPLVVPTPPQPLQQPEQPTPTKRIEPAPVVATVPDTSKAPGAFELDARLGFGFRSVSFSSTSYATPFRAAFGFPSLSLGVTFYPARLLRSSALTGLHLQGRYAVGWVLQQLPLAGAQVLPSDGRVALGYSIRAGVLELTPRALYRIAIGGVERNPFFDDGYFQSLGGELAIGVVTSGFFLHVTPRAGAIVDVGTQMVRGYGASKGGFTWGGSAEVGWRLSPYFLLSGTYQLTVAKTEFAGQGERTLEAMTVNDTIHAGYVVLTLEQ